MPHDPQPTAESAERLQSDRAEHGDTTHKCHIPHAPETTRDLLQGPAGEKIVRAERAPSPTLDEACAEISRAASGLISDRLEQEDFSATNEGLSRPLAVHEKQMRQYRSGEKRIPLGALLLWPMWLVDALLDEIRSRRHRVPDATAGVAALRAALSRLEQVAPSALNDAQRQALISDLGAATGRVGALLGQLAKGGGR